MRKLVRKCELQDALQVVSKYLVRKFFLIVCYSASKVLAWVQVLYLSDREKAFVKTKFGPVFSVSTMCVRRN